MHPLYYTDGSGSFLRSPVPGSPSPHFHPPLLLSAGLLSLEAAFSTWHSGFTLCPPAHRYPVPRSEWSCPDVTGEPGLGTILLAKFRHRASASADGAPSPPARNNPSLPTAGILALPCTPGSLGQPRGSLPHPLFFCPSHSTQPHPQHPSLHTWAIMELLTDSLALLPANPSYSPLPRDPLLLWYEHHALKSNPFRTVQRWEQPQNPLMDEQISKLRYIHTMGYYIFTQ